MKPDPAIYQLLVERHAVDPEKAVFVDDAIKNVEAAAALGFDAIQFRSPEQLREELLQRGLLAPVD
jgi:2-haloacid dehalogenase